MLRYVREKEHFDRGHDGDPTLMQAMFSEIFTQDTADSSSTATSSAGKQMERKRYGLSGSYLSGKSAASSHSGAVRRVEQRHGLGGNGQDPFTTLYFRCKNFQFTIEERNAFNKELKVAWRADVASREGGCSAKFCLEDVYKSARGFHFCNLVRGTERTLIRSPRGEALQWATVVQTDEPGSFGEVRAIIDVFGMTWCLVQWFTSEYRGSIPKSLVSSTITQVRSAGGSPEEARVAAIKALHSPRSGAGSKLQDHFFKYHRTKKYSLLHVSQIQCTVHMVPCFDTDSFFWHNTRALGTALQAYHLPKDVDTENDD